MATIRVFAGTNGAGKSSVVGAYAEEQGWDYYNPDVAARKIHAAMPDLSPNEVDSLAWRKGLEGLERAIAENRNYAFETTLGGNTVPAALARAADKGLAVRMWYVGLTSAELHIARVGARVAKGGHDIPAAKIRERYDKSRATLVWLLPKLTELWVYDNSAEGDPDAGIGPTPRLWLHTAGGRIVSPATLDGMRQTPDWAKEIVMAAVKLFGAPGA